MRRIIRIHQDGEERVIRRFLWRPRSFISHQANVIDWRWLTIAYIKQYSDAEYLNGKDITRWIDIGFVGKDWKTHAAIKKLSDSTK